MSHPPCSPELSCSDYHIFRSMQYSLNGKIFNDGAVKLILIEFIDRKDQTFYGRRIMAFIG